MPLGTTLFGVPLSFDPIACLLGAVAVMLAWVAYRSSSYHFVRLEDFRATFIGSARAGGSGPSLEVTILNRGLPIHDVNVFLYFETGGEPSIRFSSDMRPLEPIKDMAFDKGMRCHFVLRPLQDRHPEWFENRIRTLTNPRKQNAAIVIKSGNFIVQTIPLVSRMEGLLEKWNQLAISVNFWLISPSKAGWLRGVRMGEWLPIFGLRGRWYLLSFVQSCTGMTEKNQNTQSLMAAQRNGNGS